MEAPIERALGHELLHLSGPLMDMYLEQIGRGIMKKLGQKHLTGDSKPFKEFIPHQIFKNMVRCLLCMDVMCITITQRRRRHKAQRKYRKYKNTGGPNRKKKKNL